MRTRNKALLLALCAVMLVAASVLGTLAYLTSTDSVENTFTVGQVAITLDEAKVTDMGEKEDGTERVKANTYKLIPGRTYTKDPTIHVDAESENCWLFVKIENEIAAIEDETTIDAQMTAKGWSLVTGTTNIYSYKDIAKANDNVVVFSSFKIDGDKVVNSETPKTGEFKISDYDGKTVKVTAYAIQADGFATAAAAWAAAKLA